MEKRYAFLKTMLYTAGTLLVLLCSALWQRTMREGSLERGFFTAQFGCFVLACCLIGIAVYGYIAFVRKRHPVFRADVLFLLLTGLFLMVLTLICFFRYGGLSGTFEEEGYVAANFLIVVLSVLPLPFLVRTGVTALSRSEVRKGYRYTMWVAAGLLVTLYLVLLATGGMFHTVTYAAPEGVTV